MYEWVSKVWYSALSLSLSVTTVVEESERRKRCFCMRHFREQPQRDRSNGEDEMRSAITPFAISLLRWRKTVWTRWPRGWKRRGSEKADYTSGPTGQISTGHPAGGIGLRAIHPDPKIGQACRTRVLLRWRKHKVSKETWIDYGTDGDISWDRYCSGDGKFFRRYVWFLSMDLLVCRW